MKYRKIISIKINIIKRDVKLFTTKIRGIINLKY